MFGSLIMVVDATVVGEVVMFEAVVVVATVVDVCAVVVGTAVVFWAFVVGLNVVDVSVEVSVASITSVATFVGWLLAAG